MCTLQNRSDWLAFQEIFVRREYDEAIDRALGLRQADRDVCVLDLGANIGLFTMYCVDRAIAAGVDSNALSVLAVEGSPRTFKRLEVNVRQWQTLLPNLVAVHGLVGRRHGVGRIEDGWGHLGNAVGAGGKSAREVPYLDLEELCAGFEGIDLLKCDIEGSELEFIDEYPLLIAASRVAAIEFHGERPAERADRTKLEALGFVPVGKRRSVAAPSGSISLETYVRSPRGSGRQVER